MDEQMLAELAAFQAQTTKQERDRWKPLYQMLTRREKKLRLDRVNLPDRDERAAARAQYELVKGLLAVTPILEPTLLRTPKPRRPRAEGRA